jgi:hypothetical protein
MEAASCYKVGEADASGFKEYSFAVQVNGNPHLYQIRARSLDEAVNQLGDSVTQDFRQLRELGGAAGAMTLVTVIVGGVVLGAMALRKILNHVFGVTKTPPTSQEPTSQEPIALQFTHPSVEDDPAVQTEQSPVVSETILAPDPYPWVSVTEKGVQGWRSGPPGEHHWRIVVYSDTPIEAIRSEFARAPDENPETHVQENGVVVYRFPLAALAGPRLEGSGIVDVAIAPEPPPDPSSLEIVAASEEAALKTLIEYFEIIG